jgi:hypothetical protein
MKLTRTTQNFWDDYDVAMAKTYRHLLFACASNYQFSKYHTWQWIVHPDTKLTEKRQK